jgi:hypothetical protein
MCTILIFPSDCLDWDPTSLVHDILFRGGSVHDILLFEAAAFIKGDNKIQLIAARRLVYNTGSVCMLGQLRDLALRQTQ